MNTFIIIYIKQIVFYIKQIQIAIIIAQCISVSIINKMHKCWNKNHVLKMMLLNKQIVVGKRSFHNQNMSEMFNTNNVISPCNLRSFNYGYLKYSFSTFIKKNTTTKTEHKSSNQQKHHQSNKNNNPQKYQKNQQSGYKKVYNNNRPKDQNQNDQHKTKFNLNNKQYQSIKQQSHQQQSNSKQPHKQQQKPQYEMNPDILQFNKQLTSFIQANLYNNKTTSTIKTTQQQQPQPIQQHQDQPKQQELKVTTSFLSNLYKFMTIKADYLQVDAKRCLSPINRRRISQLIRLKQRQTISDNNNQQNVQQQQQQQQQINNNNNNVVYDSQQQQQKISIYHEQLCNTMYLCSVVNEKKRFSNIVSEFLLLLGMQSYQKKYGFIRFTFIMSQKQLPTKQSSIINNNNNNNTIKHLPIIIPLIFPPTLSLTHDTLQLQIIKTTIQNRSTQQLLSALRCLSKLLTIKQLKTIDLMIDQHFLQPTEYSIKKNKQKQRSIIKSDNNNSNNRILSIQQLSKLMSILSQLSVNGASIRTCQHIFKLLVQKQQQIHTEVLQTLKQQILQSSSTSLQQSAMTMSLVINLPISILRFQILIKSYIALSQIGAINLQTQHILQQIIITKFHIQRLINTNRQIIKDVNVWRQLSYRYCINVKDVNLLTGVMHKFKRGSELIVIMMSDGVNDSVIKNNSNNGELMRDCNLWIQIYKYYSQSQQQQNKTIPDQFTFPILSGLYRAYSPLFINLISQYYQKKSSKSFISKHQQQQRQQNVNKKISQVDSIIQRLTLRLYDLDKQVSYLKELQIQKLIELVIVVNLGANITLMKSVNQLMNNNNNNKKKQQKEQQKLFIKSNTINISLCYQFINRLLIQITNRTQQSQKQKLPKHQNMSQKSNKNNNNNLNNKNDTNNNIKLNQQQQQQQQQPPINNTTTIMMSPQLIKQHNTIQSILQFYLLLTKAQLQLFHPKNYSIRINNNKKQDKNRNNNNDSNNNFITLAVEQVLKEIKLTMKKNKINQQTSQLISILIQNTQTLSYYIRTIKQQQQKQSNSHNKTNNQQLALTLEQFTNSLQSFIGFNPQQQLNQYQHQLQTNLIVSLFPYLHEQQDQQMLNAITKRLMKICSNGDNKQLKQQVIKQFVTQKLIINNLLLTEQIIRINLIDNEEHYQMYQHINNNQNQNHQNNQSKDQ